MLLKKLIPALSAFLVLAACSQKLEQGGERVDFDAVMVPGEMTKAAGEIGGVSDIYSGIGVFACNTGRYRYADSNANPDFMYNERVYYDSGHWTYDIPKYWPEGYVSFFAYAPYSSTWSFSDQDEKGNPWLVYQLSADVASQVDLLYAVALTDQTRPAAEGKMTFSFRHALACVGEQVSVACSSALQDALAAEVGPDEIRVLLNSLSVTYNLTSKARMVLWNQGDANWEPILSGEMMTSRTVSYLSGSDYLLYSTAGGVSDWTSAGGEGVFYIPLDVSGNYQTAVINLEYTILRITGSTTASSRVTDSKTIQLRSVPSSFAPGKKMDLTVRLLQADP